MAQLTIYLPDDLERALRKRAKRSGQSLSSVVADLARREFRPDGWPSEFEDLFGSWEGELPEPDDPPPDEVAFEVREPARRRGPSRR
jgi:hypothetical protein